MRPLRWWFHRHRKDYGGWSNAALSEVERCRCGAARFVGASSYGVWLTPREWN